MDQGTLDHEFLRPLCSAWIAKLEQAKESRSQWKSIADDCHDEKTEVLTDSGWKFFAELAGTELLATVNLATDTIEFQQPTRIVKRPSRGDMIRFSGKTLDAVVTPNHRMVCFSAHSDEVRMKEAASLLRSDRLKLTAANWQGAAPALPDFMGDTDPAEFAEWLGFYIAEGWCLNWAPKSKDPTYPIGIAQKKQSGKDYYEALSAKMPFRTPPHQEKCKCYIFSHKKLWKYLKQFGDDCYSKVVPQWIKDAPQDVISAFLRGFLAGDGHISKDGMTVAGTSSKQLADDLQELWLKVGRSASIRVRPPAPYSISEEGKPTRTGMSGVFYLVTAWKPGKKASLKRHNDNYIELKYSTVEYDGMVYCATVANGTLITRRNGIPLISGNCMMFYSQSAQAMWDPSYAKKFWKNVKLPRFRITINKAFEMVAVFGPNLMWEIPHRKVEAKKVLQLPPELFGQDEQGQMMLQEMLQTQQQETGRDKIVSYLMDCWLNYTPREQPSGGLGGHSERAKIDALVKGRGCLATRPYKMPGSGRQLTGAFYVDPYDLYLDPDFDSVDESRWMAIRHIEPHYEVEERFELEKNSLKGRATLESSWSYSEQLTDDQSAARRKAGQTGDNVVWYEIYSKSGPGCRNTSMDSPIREHLEDVVGKYAYIAICPDVPYPLNMPSEKIRKGSVTDEEVQQAFSWPVPLWADDRWPVEFLDFYHNPESAWPIAPMAPGLGELKLLNFLVSWMANRTWSSSRDFWAVAAPHVEHYREYLINGEDQAIIPTPIGVEDIDKAIKVLQQPETRQDMSRLIQFVSDMFDKRVGLTPFAYGMNQDGTQNRTAEETQAKSRAVSARPEFMQKQVVEWQGRIAQSEAFVTRWFVRGEDVAQLVGPVGAKLWDQYIVSTDVELVTRQFNYTIEAASIRRPNRERDIANFQQIVGLFMPIMQQYGEQTGNYEPFNFIMKRWAEYHDADLDGAVIPPPEEPTEEQQQFQQIMQELEVQKLEADIEKIRAEAQAKLASAQPDQAEQQKLQMEVEREAMKAQVQMQTQQATSQQDLQIKQETSVLDLLQGAAEHRQEMEQDREKHEQDMILAKQKAEAAIKQAKAMAAAKPKPTSKPATKPAGSK